jgi:ANTAR domain/GAF domain
VFGWHTVEVRQVVENRELWLAEAVVELAEAADTDDCEADCARRLISRLSELLTPAEAGLLLLSDGADILVPVAGTSHVMRLLEPQKRQNDGFWPYWYRSGQALLNRPISTAGARWPAFVTAARAAGFDTVSVLPVSHRDDALGVACVLAGHGQPVSGSSLSLAQVLVRTAAMAIAHHRELSRNVRTAEQLQRALDSRVLIEQAKGILAARLGSTPDIAFELLRTYARGSSRKLAEVAAAVVQDELQAHVLVAAHEGHRIRAASARPSSQVG